MKVILMSDLRHRGRRGQVVEVKPGFARNFLLPQGLALLASPGNIKRFEHEKKKIDARHDAALEVATAAARADHGGQARAEEARDGDRHALRLGVGRRHRRGAAGEGRSRSIAGRSISPAASRRSATTSSASSCMPTSSRSWR